MEIFDINDECKVARVTKNVVAAVKAFVETPNAAFYVVVVPPNTDDGKRMIVISLGDHPTHTINATWGVLSSAIETYEKNADRCQCESCKGAIIAARQCIAIMEGIKACRH